MCVFRDRNSVSSLCGSPRRITNRSAGRPPTAWVRRRAKSMTRPVRLAKSGATSGKRSPKVWCPHAGLRHRQRASLSRRITLAPWTGRSCNCRTYQPCRKFDSRPQPGHRPPPAVMAETIQAASVLSTPKTRTPGPGAQSALSLMPHQHTRPGDRTIPLDQDSQGTPTQIEADPPRVKQTRIRISATAAAVTYGLWPSLLACLGSVVTFNFFFLPPHDRRSCSQSEPISAHAF